MSNPVIIGSARHDEFGGIGYGANVKPGDQTGSECETQEWYLHEYGWTVIRPKSQEVAECIAQDMEYICANPHIGYSQPHDQTLYNVSKPLGFNAAMVHTDCETDCAKAVRVCVCYAGIETENDALIDCPDFYTGNETAVLNRTGQFDVLTEKKYTESQDYLKRGDILNTNRQGHTVVVLSDGDYAYTEPSYTTSGNVYLREGAGTEYPVVRNENGREVVVPKNTAFDVLSYAEAADGTTWAQGFYKGYCGYVSGKYLRPAITMPKYTATGNVHLRKGAGVLYGSLCVIPKGAVVVGTGGMVNVLGRAWYEVIYDGKKGWASSKYLK